MGSRAWRRNQNARKLASSRCIGVQVAGNSPPVCPRLPRNIKPPVPPLNHSAPWPDLHQPHPHHQSDSQTARQSPRLFPASTLVSPTSSVFSIACDKQQQQHQHHHHHPSLLLAASSCCGRISHALYPASAPPADPWQFAPDDFKTLKTAQRDPKDVCSHSLRIYYAKGFGRMPRYCTASLMPCLSCPFRTPLATCT